MNSTSESLLARLHGATEREAWEKFVKLYTPLLFFWAKRLGLQEPDAADLVQEVFAVLVRKLPQFAYNSKLGFRSWLHTVMINKWRDGQRRRGVRFVSDGDAAIAGQEDSATGSTLEENEYRQHLMRRALELMQVEFESTTWKACWEFVVGARPASEVATELGISVNAVYVAKSRVLRRLRQELAGLLD
jgi:RNA polymerase sigma-70 factor (ECF subfamily)